MATYLDKILASHREAARADNRDVAALVAEAEKCPPARGFAAALRHRPRLAAGVPSVIAEIKRRSPSKGPLAPDLVPGVLAKSYAAAGAACLSVLTDKEFFGGSPEDLGEARSAVELPVLRKDFTVNAADVCDARLMGADALLLIVGALSPGELAEFLQLARNLGLDALVEVHDEAEAELALSSGAQIVGVNQRDLVTFSVDTDRAVRVSAAIPGTVVRVAESGIRTRDDVRRLADAGFDAVLVGEALVTAADPGAALASLTEAVS
ncbi:MAG TPA: indole-3-glycerol phosphate synthase TrpC [Acidimicrobiales bacterium]|nr:indole-3-glycerol phosphate synthase TrpC [Acidimicrobiales bacterium]